MVTNRVSEVVQQLRTAMLLQDRASRTDAELLTCFLANRDEAAAAALVQRHGPMVWGVCRRMLRHVQDAEDAFQATFLVLVRKAASIVPRERVANWLYGVAHHIALKARALAARRRERERQVAVMPEPAAKEDALWASLKPLLDQELSRLPDRYRAVLVQCDLEGRTRKEAARQLRVPEGTIAGRLARARALLARRLARHGSVVSGGALALVLAHRAAADCVPAVVASATVRAVSLVAAGQTAASGVISANVAALTEGVGKTMLLTKLKIAVLAVLVLAGASWGASVYLVPDPAPAQAASREKAPPKPPVRKATPAALQSLWADLGSDQEIRAARAMLALAATPKETTAFLKKHLRPVKAGRERVAQLLADLASGEFKKRQAASDELAYLGKYVKRQLEQSLTEERTEEVRRRLTQLLAKIPSEAKVPAAPAGPLLLRGNSVSASSNNGVIEILIDGKPLNLNAMVPPAPARPNLGWLRAERAVVVLEEIATREARGLLEVMAVGEADAPPTKGARAALERLHQAGAGR
jgi:RNA polymerase sigma factor (sigma-70 family)